MARKRRMPLDIFEEFSRLEEEMLRMMDQDWEEFGLREGEPIVYGFNMRVGPGGEPIVEKFGNLEPTEKGARVKDEREPLVDVIEREEDVTVIAEMPGVSKEEINVQPQQDQLIIQARGETKYFKRIRLPARVKTEEAKARYKNGVLEVVLMKEKKSRPRQESLKVE